MRRAFLARTTLLALCTACSGVALEGCELFLGTGDLTERSDDGGGQDGTIAGEGGGDSTSPAETGGDSGPDATTETGTNDAGKDAPADASTDAVDAAPVCVIGGMTYASGTTNPTTICQACEPSMSSSAWTSVAEGMSCGTAQICHAGACSSGCDVMGSYSGASTKNPNDPCQVCQPSMSTSAWSSVTDGTGCGGGQVCSGGQCGTQCDIGGTIVPTGQANPTNACQTCQPGTSTTAWTNEHDGTGCGTGVICASGQCTAKCFIGGTVYASSQANASNACQTCQPATNTMAWTTSSDGAGCGTNMVCHQGTCMTCAANTMCTPSSNVCDKGVIVCSTGLPTCPDPGTPDPAQNGKACGTGGICQSGTCTQQLTVSKASVTATQNFPVYGPVAFVTDMLTSEAATTLKGLIDWGDGNSNYGVVSGGSGSFVVSGSHTYATSVGASVMITVMVSDTSTSASANVTYAATVRPVATGTPHLFSTTTPSAGPEQLALGPDNNLWFTEFSAGKVAQITTAGAITEVPTPTASSNPRGIAGGPGGYVWYTEYSANQAGYLKPGQAINNEIMLSASSYDPGIMRVGPDGNLWISALGGVIYRMNPGGTYITFSVPSGSIDIAAGPDGNVWFTDGSIAHINASGTGYTSFKTPTASAGTNGITLGPDSNMWVTEPGLPGIGRCTTSGVVTEFKVTNPGASPSFITAGPDGNVWFTDIGTTTVAVGRITPTGAITEFPLSSGSQPVGIISGPDGNIWYADSTGSQIGRMTP
jgi:streptogramin lyase